MGLPLLFLSDTSIQHQYHHHGSSTKQSTGTPLTGLLPPWWLTFLEQIHPLKVARRYCRYLRPQNSWPSHSRTFCNGPRLILRWSKTSPRAASLLLVAVPQNTELLLWWQASPSPLPSSPSTDNVPADCKPVWTSPTPSRPA